MCRGRVHRMAKERECSVLLITASWLFCLTRRMGGQGATTIASNCCCMLVRQKKYHLYSITYMKEQAEYTLSSCWILLDKYCWANTTLLYCSMCINSYNTHIFILLKITKQDTQQIPPARYINRLYSRPCRGNRDHVATENTYGFAATTLHLVPMSYNICNFGRDQAIMKGALLEEHSTSSAVPLVPLVGFSWNLISSAQPPFSTKRVNVVSVSR